MHVKIDLIQGVPVRCQAIRTGIVSNWLPLIVRTFSRQFFSFWDSVILSLLSSTGSVPFLLKEHLSYSQLATFALASYPYSLKLLWSPIVDSVYWPYIGRRKSWIIPMQTITGSLMMYISMNSQRLLADVSIMSLVARWFTSHFNCFSQVTTSLSYQWCLRHSFSSLLLKVGDNVIRFRDTDTEPLLFILDIAVDGMV